MEILNRRPNLAEQFSPQETKERVNKRDLLSIADLSAEELWRVIFLASELKEEFNSRGKNEALLAGKGLVMIFEKPSLRTKLSFDLAIYQLGGHPVYFGPEEVGLGKRESVADISKVTSSMGAAFVVARVFKHKDLEELSQNSKVTVINALSDLEHPCQALADFLTIWEAKGTLGNLNLAFVGDGENNVPHSLALGCALLGINFRCASPVGYWMKKDIVEKANRLALKTGAEIFETNDPAKAVEGADVVYTDTWVSMGDQQERNQRLKIFKSYQVDKRLMNLAKNDAIFMHDMPAYRGNEVTADVIDGPQSVVFQQAENRLHAQKSLLVLLCEKFSQSI